LAEKSGAEQLKLSDAEKLFEYGVYLSEGCSLITKYAREGNKNAIHDYLRIANSLLSIRRILSAYTDSGGLGDGIILVIEGFIPESVKKGSKSEEATELMEDLEKNVVDEILPEILSDAIAQNGMGIWLKAYRCEECIPETLLKLHPHIQKLEDDEETREIKKLEGELWKKIGIWKSTRWKSVRRRKPKGHRIAVE